MERRKKEKRKYHVQQDIFNLIKAISGQSNIVSIPAAFIDYTGSLQAGLFLSQLLYWTDRAKDGWIYKTYSDWKNEIHLSEYEVRKAKNLLEKNGILETKVKKANGNPTLHYCLKMDNFSDSFLKFLRNETQNLKVPLIEITTEITNINSLSKDKDYVFSKHEEIFSFWNNLPNTTTHSKTNTKIYKTISLQIENLLCGKPLIRKKDFLPTKPFSDFLAGNNIPSDLHTKIWEADEIKDILQTIHDEYSSNKDKLSLDNVFWNAFAKRRGGGFSLFLHTATQINIPQEYIQIADKLTKAIGKNNLTASHKKQDAQEFQDFIEGENIPIDEVNDIIDWYRINQGGKYIPVIDSVQEFRQKYSKLIRAKNNNPSENKIPEALLAELSPAGFPLIVHSYDRTSKKKKTIDEWQLLLERYANKLLDNTGIWKQNHIPDKITVFNGIVSMQKWLDNVNFNLYGGDALWHRIKPLDKLIDYYITCIDEWWGWMDGVKDNIFDVNNKIFKMFIRELEDSFATHINIKSKNWENDSDWVPRN